MAANQEIIERPKRPAPRRRTEEEKRQWLATKATEAEALRPKVVAESGRVVRDADVVVSRADPNAQHRGGDTGVRVRRSVPTEPPLAPMRPGEVRINMAAAEADYWQRVRDAEADRQQRRMLDPCNLGIWGRWDD